jgi:hypothetical protein
MKTYKVLFDKLKNKGVYGISLVHDPAMESMFIALNKDNKETNLKGFEMKLAEIDEKEFTLLGVALIPDKEIYRNQGGQEFNITFPKETVKDVAHNFIQMGYQKNSSVEHGEEISGVSIVEAWLVKDPKNDTANAYKLPKEDIVEGAWVVKMKCDNKEIYQDALDGNIQGFSIDAFVNLEEINLKSDKKMSAKLVEMIKELPEKIALALNLNKEEEKKDEEIKLGSVNSADGTVEIMFDGEQLQAGSTVSAVDAEGGNVPLPVGEYELEGGLILVVTEVGVAAEVKEAAPVDEAPIEENLESDENVADALDKAIQSILIKYDKNVDLKITDLRTELKADFKKENDSLKKENETLKAEVLELQKQPAAKPIKTAPTQVDYSKLSNREKMEYNRENN